ncbi:MAG: hypothetical protein HC897_02525, partial [Thermoanaerobaculia bacterium]|nr:hypothetical protein [Thermoanaerobaculia bacterium]
HSGAAAGRRAEGALERIDTDRACQHDPRTGPARERHDVDLELFAPVGAGDKTRDIPE